MNHSTVRQFISSYIAFLLEKKRYVVFHYNAPDKAEIFDQIRAVRSKRHMLGLPSEGCNVYLLTKATEKLKGDIAEVGTFEGASAKIICLAKGKRMLHIFDTFQGLPNPGDNDDRILSKGMFSATLSQVKQYLRGYKNIHFYKGVFPSETSRFVKKRNFSFVNLDLDLYEGTRDSLRFFYPRMTAGGVLLCHDYSLFSGVKRAVDEFFRDKNEPVIELTGSQCVITKTSL